MIFRVTLLWIFGLVTLVPYAVWQLLFYAQRDEYAFLITISLFWVFGFWGVVGPLITAIRIRKLFKTLEKASSAEEFKRTLATPESEELAIEVVASENHLPKFLVRFLYRKIVARLPETSGEAPRNSEP